MTGAGAAEIVAAAAEEIEDRAGYKIQVTGYKLQVTDGALRSVRFLLVESHSQALSANFKSLPLIHFQKKDHPLLGGLFDRRRTLSGVDRENIRVIPS
ncbi:MAG: hypothetical protein AMXMBFR60_25680 [Chloroflexota bacterium]